MCGNSWSSNSLCMLFWDGHTHTHIFYEKYTPTISRYQKAEWFECTHNLQKPSVMCQLSWPTTHLYIKIRNSLQKTVRWKNRSKFSDITRMLNLNIFILFVPFHSATGSRRTLGLYAVVFEKFQPWHWTGISGCGGENPEKLDWLSCESLVCLNRDKGCVVGKQWTLKN